MSKITRECVDENGTYYEFEFPAKKAICPKCDGEGHHTNPNIDGNGLDEESVSDPDFMESYMRGDYDETCLECNGEKIILEIDESMCGNLKTQLDDYYRREDEIYQNEREIAAERRFFERAMGG